MNQSANGYSAAVCSSIDTNWIRLVRTPLDEHTRQEETLGQCRIMISMQQI